MKYLIYLSTAVEIFDQAQLEALLHTCRTNNPAKEITGLLLYHDGAFIQLLEGDSASVDQVFKQICADERHKNIITIAEGEHRERAFGQWAMGFRRATAEDFAGLEAFMHPRQAKQLNTDSDHPALDMLRTFAQTNF